MNLQTLKIQQPKILFAVLGLVALSVATLALAAGVGAQADLPGGGSATYADPQPCGPGANTAFMDEPHEIKSGHFYLFDTYWQDTTAEQSSDEKTGFLRTNTCPPKLVTTTEDDGEGNTTTVTSLADSGIDVDEAIFHVLDAHEATLIENAADAANYPNVTTHLRLDHYTEVDDSVYVNAGDQVWWLRLDDPNTGTDSSPVDETSDLVLGFSTDRFDAKHWARKDDQPAFRYMFEVERNPGIAPDAHPHLLVYKKRGADIGGNVTEAELVWDSAKVHTQPMTMEPGELEDLQWVFTKPGTYALSVHAIGWVREENPHKSTDSEYDASWKRISPNITETSEVKRYVIQVGDPLDEEEPPVFGVNLSLPENSAAGTLVGGPIPAYWTESTTLTYTLTGEGSDQFTMEALTEPHRVQIKVADGANLDFETRPAYDFALGVSNEKDHEGNADDVIDDVLAVRIELEDEAPSITLSATDTQPILNERVTLRTAVREVPPGRAPILTWYHRNENHDHWSELHLDGRTYRFDHLIDPGPPHAKKVSWKVRLAWGTGVHVESNVITLDWQEAP